MRYYIDESYKKIDNQTMKNNLHQIRMEREIKQIAIAKAMKIGQSTISEIESGKKYPSVYIALKLANYFCCTVEDLFELDSNEL